jgi:hypothetical protein
MAVPSIFEQNKAITAQLTPALVGYPALTGQPPGAELFSAPPVNYGGALRHAAFWMAVAARYLGDRTLALSAWGMSQKALPYVVMPSTAGTADMSKVLNDAAAEIRKEALTATDPVRKGLGLTVANRLQSQGLPTELAKAQDQDDSITGTLRKLLATFETAAKVAAALMVVVLGITAAGGAWFVYRKFRR